MGLKCGIVGLPNVGKSTIFNAVTANHVPAENYPFCTTDHNEGVVTVPDPRLDHIASIFKPQRVVPAAVEFVDIAGLVKNAHTGEGLGNKFLHYISEVNAIAHVVRCFDSTNVVHVEGEVDPIHDIEIINTELLLYDLDKVDRAFEKNQKAARLGDKEAKKLFSALEPAKKALDAGTPLRVAGLKHEDLEALKPLFLLTTKPVIFVANGNETDIKTPSDRIKAVEKYAASHNAECIVICGGIEGELIDLSKDEQKAFLADLGLNETGLERLIHKCYKLLGLITFFTKDGPEVRAWTITTGTKAPQAAGQIHTDFEKGFIKADVYSYDDLLTFGNEHTIREKGHIRSEGHEYVIKEGDVIHFKFNV